MVFWYQSIASGRDPSIDPPSIQSDITECSFLSHSTDVAPDCPNSQQHFVTGDEKQLKSSLAQYTPGGNECEDKIVLRQSISSNCTCM